MSDTEETGETPKPLAYTPGTKRRGVAAQELSEQLERQGRPDTTPARTARVTAPATALGGRQIRTVVERQVTVPLPMRETPTFTDVNLVIEDAQFIKEKRIHKLGETGRLNIQISAEFQELLGDFARRHRLETNVIVNALIMRLLEEA